MAIIQTCRVFSDKDEEEDKIIDYIINSSSSSEYSENPRIHIDSDKNEVEIELDTIKLDEIDDERKNNNFNSLRKKKEINENKLKNSNSSIKNCLEFFKIIISSEIGEKVQIFNMGLASNLMNIKFLFIGNFCGIILINAIIIIFGIKILQKKINNLFLLLEAVFYLSFAVYYIYIFYF